MQHKINTHYPMSELQAITAEYGDNPLYDINELWDETTEQGYVEVTARDMTFVRDDLRRRREVECFAIINRGKLWYDTLTPAQVSELNVWYAAWLDVTDTLVVPERPVWL